jgi:hypothetical protein
MFIMWTFGSQNDHWNLMWVSWPDSSILNYWCTYCCCAGEEYYLSYSKILEAPSKVEVSLLFEIFQWVCLWNHMSGMFSSLLYIFQVEQHIEPAMVCQHVSQWFDMDRFYNGCIYYWIVFVFVPITIINIHTCIVPFSLLTTYNNPFYAFFYIWYFCSVQIKFYFL